MAEVDSQLWAGDVVTSVKTLPVHTCKCGRPLLIVAGYSVSFMKVCTCENVPLYGVSIAISQSHSHQHISNGFTVNLYHHMLYVHVHVHII